MPTGMTIIKRLEAPVPARAGRIWDTHPLPGGMENGTTTSRSSWIVSQLYLSHNPAIPLRGAYPRKMKAFFHTETFHKESVHTETFAQMFTAAALTIALARPTGGKLVNVVYPCDGIVLSIWKKQATDTWRNLRLLSKWKKPSAQEYLVCDSIGVSFSRKDKKYRNQKKSRRKGVIM